LALAIPSPGLSPISCIRTLWAASASSVRLKKNYVKSHLIRMCRRFRWQLWLCPRLSSLRSFVRTITIKFVSHYGPWDCRTQILDEQLSLLVLFALLLALLSITFIIWSNLLEQNRKTVSPPLRLAHLTNQDITVQHVGLCGKESSFLCQSVQRFRDDDDKNFSKCRPRFPRLPATPFGLRARTGKKVHDRYQCS
jgi:hypothetical protein